MARLPKDISEAVELFDVPSDGTVVAIGPDEGYAEALADVVGTKGKVIVRDPPPELTARKKAVQIVDELPSDAKGDPVLVWMGVVSLGDLRDVVRHVAEGGALWLILPKGSRDFRANLTQGDAKKAMLPLGWRETKVVGLSTDDYAVRFHPRR